MTHAPGRAVFLFPCLFFFVNLSSQIENSFIGFWAGELIKPPYDIPLAFDISVDEGVATAQFFNPAQGVIQYHLDSVRILADSAIFFFNNISIRLEKTDTLLVGKWEQGDESNDIKLVKDAELRNPSRPQTPQPPFSYRSDTVSFLSRDTSVMLEGTLTKPKIGNQSTAVVLLTGSGPQDRDEQILGHRLFAVMADHLTRQGISVLRFDDRGMGNSEGIHGLASSYDFAEDASGAYDFLNLLGYTNIGFIGHSEGGIIAQIADSLVGGAAFHVYLAAPGITISDLMVEQNRLVLEKTYPDTLLQGYLGLIEDVFNIIKSAVTLPEKLNSITSKSNAFYDDYQEGYREHLGPSRMTFSMRFTQLLYLKWWMYFLSYEPKQYLAQIKSPILAINGSEDIQVTPSNLAAISAKAVNSLAVTTHEMKGLNHLLQQCHTCTIREYGLITQTISTEVLDIIVKWLHSLSTINHE